MEQYAKEFIEANSLADCVIKTSEDGYVYVEYSGSYEDTEYLYYATIHKAANAFWLIQFGGEASAYEKSREKIVKYASSITFNDKPMVNM